ASRNVRAGGVQAHFPIGHDDLYVLLVRIGPHSEARADVPNDAPPGVHGERLSRVVRDLEVRCSVEIRLPRRGAVGGWDAEPAVRAQEDSGAIGEPNRGAVSPGGGELAHRWRKTRPLQRPERRRATP